MTALEIYRAQYEEQLDWYEDKKSKYEWAATDIFGLTTYDGDLDERFVKDILEVCKVILERRNFEYIEASENNYIKYILVCQLLDRLHWIDWGTSIRGAWLDVDTYYDYKTRESTVRSRDILDELEWWDSEHHIIEKVPFTVDNLKDLIKFMEE